MKSGFIVTGLLLIAALCARAEDKHPFSAAGLYTETCSCKAPCSCEMTGLNKGCEGVGAIQLAGGSYNGQDLTGLKAAYAAVPSEWVRLYVQGATPAQAEAGKAFLKAVFVNWGKVESIADAQIEIAGTDGNYTVTVNGGSVMKYQTKPVMGADKKTPILHSNVNDLLNKTFKQGLSITCTYKDGEREITLDEGRNAFFNDEMNASGNI